MEVRMGDSKVLGRNDPCHCGSGIKYKKCCLDKDVKSEYDLVKYVTNNPELSSRFSIKGSDVDLFIYPWERIGFSGVGKYAIKKAEQTTNIESSPESSLVENSHGNTEKIEQHG